MLSEKPIFENFAFLVDLITVLNLKNLVGAICETK